MIFKNLTLIDWYLANRRNLFWRSFTDAYTVWLSEIILQQTRVNQGLNYIKNFKNAYPTIHHLAQAPIDEVLKLWQGLGYYARACNLHATAKLISEDFNGEFPKTYEGLRKLKGVGDYTAAAIASISFKIPVAAVDGNVFRVLARVFGIFTPIDSAVGRKEFAELAQKLIDKNRPDIYNQAIMEFGAIHCTPKKAKCDNCLFNDTCYAYINNCVYSLPVKANKIKVRTRYFYYLVVMLDNYTFIHKRSEKDIWHSLYEFPLIESETELTSTELAETNGWKELLGGQSIVIQQISDSIKHKLSHQTLYCRFYKIAIKKPAKKLLQAFMKIDVKEIEKFSVPRLIENYVIKELDEK